MKKAMDRFRDSEGIMARQAWRRKSLENEKKKLAKFARKKKSDVLR